MSIARRKAVLAITRDFHETSFVYPVMFFSVSLALYLGAITAIGLLEAWYGKLAWGVVLSIAAGKLFVAGHDACHGSFTPSGRLNRTFGRMALIAAYHLPAAWRYWHNVTAPHIH